MNCVTTKHFCERRVALFAMLTLFVGSLQAQTTWQAAQYNPSPSADDIILPMPCGGAMTFRRVVIPSADILDDRRVQLGGPEPRFSYTENSRSDYVGGGFTDRKVNSQRYFLIGKYEVTQLQFESLFKSCTGETGESRLPKTGITWTEAAHASGLYSSWLAKNAVKSIPDEDGAIGFVRLPTEAEWEFAARGGVAVAPTEFEQQMFPMPEGPQRYVWYAGTDSSNNELNVVGLLKPNPLGLHDMLGNAGEFVLDAFRLNKHSRLHGQAGGYTVKGGDYRTSLSDIRTAARTEYVPIERLGERRDKATGFRLVVASASLPTPARLQSVRAAWTNLAQPTRDDPLQALADPVKEIDALAQAINDPSLKARIARIGGVVRANIQARNEQRDRSAKSEIRVGSYLVRKLLEDRRKIRSLESIVAGPLSENLKSDARANLAASKAALDGTTNYLLETLKQIGLDFPATGITAQGELLKREFDARLVPGYGPPIDLIVRLGHGFATGKPIDKPSLLLELGKLEQK